MNNKDFEQRNETVISEMGKDVELEEVTRDWFNKASKREYSYHFTWMGIPIIQFPQDIVALQEIIFRIKPDLIIETGIARGGSIIFSASMLELIGGDGDVLGIDIDIREHNRKEIENHPMMKRITMIEGSSTDESVINQVRKFAKNKKRVLVILDSNHTHDHVIKELRAYAPLTSRGSYCIVFDTVVEDMPIDWNWGERSWGVGDNPKTAVFQYLNEITEKDIKGSDGASLELEIDKSIDNKLLISVAPDGYLKRA
jgi:cephalosporin hydroxylase